MESTNLGRRAFLRGRNPKFNPTAIRPPWTIEFPQFIDNCERCDKCIEVCPENILIRGDGGFPEVDFKQGEGECTFCKKCADTCDTKAFNSGDLHENNAWSHSANIAPSCFSLNAIVCRTCGDNCDENAISFKLQTGGVSIPEVDSEKCTGCGACLSVCPQNSISMMPENTSLEAA